MKRVSLFLSLVLLAVVAILPVTATTPVSAEATNLQCYYYSGEFERTISKSCDLSIDKQVSLNGGAYQNADSADQAAQAKIGDTITWKITVSDTSDESLEPFGIVAVRDVLPAGLTFGAATADTGSFSDGTWTFTIEQGLPATLVITSTASAAGQIENVATLTDYTPDNCDGPCDDPPYFDANNTNNQNSAFVTVAANPVVTTTAATPVVAAPNTPSAPSTGFGVNTSRPALTLAGFTASAAALLGTAYVIRKRATQQS